MLEMTDALRPRRIVRASLVVLRRTKTHVVAHRNCLPPAATAIRQYYEELRRSHLPDGLAGLAAVETGVPGSIAEGVPVPNADGGLMGPANYPNGTKSPLALSLSCRFDGGHGRIRT